ncbi:MAG: FapA family protein [Spirochaetes bacterium]|nr:FapA family protein [Spirochaetota bacterium]
MKRDGYAELHPSEDGLSLRCTFYPPMEGGQLLTVEYMETLLQQAGITNGILWDTISEAIFTCNTEGRIQREVLIAQGTPPVEAVPEHIALKSRLIHRKTADDLDKGGRADYKELKSYITVQKDEPLGKVIPEKEGKAGITIYGKPLNPGKKQIRILKPGKHIAIRDGIVYAEHDGLFVLEGDTFRIEEVLEIKGDVDYSVGHIEFPGDVLIHGEIHDGFNISASGTVTCMSTVDASEIFTKKDFIAKQGIIGRGKGIVRAAGSITAKFIENCTVESLGSIALQGGLFHCQTAALGEIDLGDKGRIVGGSTRAFRSIRCGSAGNQAQTPTSLYGGIHFVVERRLRFVEEKQLSATKSLQEVEKDLRHKPTEKLFQLRAQLKQTIENLQKIASELLASLYNPEDVTITIFGKVYPGVMIFIGGASYLVEQEATGVVFRIDRSTTKIRMEPLQPKTPPKSTPKSST